MKCFQALCRHRSYRLGIFDILSFVEDKILKLNFLKLFIVTTDNTVSGEDYIRLLAFVLQ